MNLSRSCSDASAARCSAVVHDLTGTVDHKERVHGRHGPLAWSNVVGGRGGHAKCVGCAWNGKIVHLVVEYNVCPAAHYLGAKAVKHKMFTVNPSCNTNFSQLVLDT